MAVCFATLDLSTDAQLTLQCQLEQVLFHRPARPLPSVFFRPRIIELLFRFSEGRVLLLVQVTSFIDVRQCWRVSCAPLAT
jgi:hypothetical protein